MCYVEEERAVEVEGGSGWKGLVLCSENRVDEFTNAYGPKCLKKFLLINLHMTM